MKDNKKINRIITFGCSNTYGESLPDVAGKESDRFPASKYSWPSVLGKLLNVPVINKAKGGACNKHIWHIILNDYLPISKPDDTVIILWSYFDRYCMFQDDGKIKRLLRTDIRNKKLKDGTDYRGRNLYGNWREWVKTWFNNYDTNKDMALDSLCRIDHIHRYLNSLGIKNYHFTCDDSKDFVYYLQAETMPDWFPKNILKQIKYEEEKYGFSSDKEHPSIEAQERMAKLIKLNIEAN
tara:strand:+ start:3363 stop:4076 length:714 start_codon:yes stop_codon:yes gene_type:complete